MTTTTAAATTLVPPVSTRRPAAHTFAGLARHELRRYVVNPVFLLGASLTILVSATAGSKVLLDINEITPTTAILLGGFAMTAAFWQARSMRPSSSVVDTTPVSLPLRSAALCTTAIVPLLCGIASLLLFRHNVHVAGDSVYGAFDPSARTATQVSQFVLPSLGGPLLGVALGRWVRFPGAGFVLFVLLYAWVTVIALPSLLGPADQTWTVGLRFLGPYTFWALYDGGTGTVTSLRGSPWFFIGWQLALCAFAVLVALLRGAEGVVRRWILRALGGVVVIAALLLVLAVQGGLPHVVTQAATAP